LFPVAQIGQQDPYCKLYCGAGGLVVKTTVDEDAGKSAVWNQCFHFDVSSLPDSDCLYFEVKDKNVMVNTSIGCGKVRSGKSLYI
jgi:C2 domain